MRLDEGEKRESEGKMEPTTDWVFDALVELTEKSGYLDGFGLDSYFIKSIARL
jgi:hypothetical protein